MAVTSASEPRIATARLDNPAYQAYWILRIGFTAAPILFGLDKFFHVLVDWDKYLAGPVDDVIPGSGHTAMLVVGGVEIAAGLVTAILPRIGGYLVAAWLATIIANLLIKAEYYDIALRDFGLLLGALTLARLATAFRGPRGVPEHQLPTRATQAPSAQPAESKPTAATAEGSGWEERMSNLRGGAQHTSEPAGSAGGGESSVGEFGQPVERKWEDAWRRARAQRGRG